MLICETTARTDLASNETTLMIATRCRDQAETKLKKLESALGDDGRWYGAGDRCCPKAILQRKDRIEYFENLHYEWSIIVDEIAEELGKPG